MSRYIDNVKLIVFDVDGTLYDQRKLRFFILIELFFYYLFRTHKYYELNILWFFRKERKKHSTQSPENINISENQYIWCQEKVKMPLDEIKKIIEKWIRQKPLKYLSYCMYKNVKDLINQLKKNNIITSVYSDYRVDEKLKAMNIQVNHVFSSEQKEIDVLKPNPKGLNYIAKSLNVSKQHILFIGDQAELDGACAKRAKVKYLHINRKSANSVYKRLVNELQ